MKVQFNTGTEADLTDHEERIGVNEENHQDSVFTISRTSPEGAFTHRGRVTRP